MNVRLVGALAVLAGILCARVSDADSARIDSNQVVPGEYLIRRAQGHATSDVMLELRQQISPDVTVLDEITKRRLVKVLVPAVQALGRTAFSIPGHPVDRYVNAMVNAALKIGALQSVEAIEPVTLLRLTDVVPGDVARATQSIDDAMRRINLQRLPKLKAPATSKPIIIAVIDGGIFLHHEIFKGLLLDGKDFTGGGSTAQAITLPDGRIETHGTGTAGMIAVTIRGGTIDRPARANIKILPIRATLTDDESIETPDAIKAIDYAISQGVSIINASWGKDGDSPELHQALADADAAKIIIVTAAGNGRRADPDRPFEPSVGFNLDDTPYYPASWPLKNLVAVAALGLDDSLASFSNWSHQSVQLAAPGENIIVPTPLVADGKGSVLSGYQAQSGTSIATAIVAGSIALFEAAHPTLDHRSIVAIVSRAVTPQASLASAVSSGGVLSVDRLLQDASAAPSGPIDAAANSTVIEGIPLSKGKFARLVKWPLSSGRIPSEAPALRGYDASGSTMATPNGVRTRVRLSPDKNADYLRASLPAALGTVKSIDAIGSDSYTVEIDTAMDKRAVDKVLRSLPGVQSAEESLLSLQTAK